MTKYELLNKLNNQILNGSKANCALARIFVKRLRSLKRVENIKELMAETGFSVATIYRFSSILGFESFILLKAKMNKYADNVKDEKYSDDFYFIFPNSKRNMYKELINKNNKLTLVFGNDDQHLSEFITHMFTVKYPDKEVSNTFTDESLLLAFNLGGNSERIFKLLDIASESIIFSKKDMRRGKKKGVVSMPIVAPYHSWSPDTRRFLDISLLVAITNLFK